MNITCHASFDANLKVSVGALSNQRGNDTNRHPPQTARSIGSPQKHVAIQSSPPEPQVPQGPEIDEDQQSLVAHATFNQQQRLSSQSNLVESLPGNNSLCANYQINVQTLSFSDSLGNFDLFPLSNTWDFDFSLEPMLDLATTFSGSPEWLSGAGSFPLATPSLAGSMDVSPQPSTMPETTEWTPKRQRRSKPNPPDTNGGAILGEDAFYLRHYEQCIGNWAYSLKDDGKGNYLRFVLDFIQDPRCSRDSPFRLAVLAWTAKHWAMTSDSDDAAWKSYYARATEGLEQMERLNDSREPSTSAPSARLVLSSTPEVAICSTLFLCRCDVLNDDLASVLSHLNNLKQRLSRYLSGRKLSAFSSQILLWLGYLHVRVSIFTASHPSCDNTVATTLLEAIISHPEYRNICERSQLYLSEIFGDSYPPEELLQDVEKAPVSVRTHETFCLIANMLRYRSWRHLAEQKACASEEHQELAMAKVEAIDVDIRRMDVEFGLAIATNASAAVLQRLGFSPNQAAVTSQFGLSTSFGISTLGRSPTTDMPPNQSLPGCCPVSTVLSPPTGIEVTGSRSSQCTISRPSLQWLSCYAAFLTAKILWSRILHPTIRTEESAATAVRSILDIALQLRQVHQTTTDSSSSWSHKIPRSMLWPLPLFMAGIETTDRIHADWIQVFMDEVTSSWGEQIAIPGQSNEAAKGANSRQIGRIHGGSRVQELMTRVRELQNHLGCRVDVESVMGEVAGTQGAFIL